VRLRCQTIERKPPGLEKTMPTYRIKACFQMPGDRYYQNFDERKNIPEVIELEISINDVLCETMEKAFSASSSPLRVCTLEDIVAEKLRALLQQVPRKRSRPQDVFDIASMVRLRGDLDLAKVSAFVKRKSEARAIFPKKSSYNETVRELARKGYDDLIKTEKARYIPFDEAWQEVLSLVHRLAIPDD
jgi:predicted nucleotidyltransferase component of viral defense system